MQPLKITIQGEFWDSYLYRGKLFLFLRDGSIQTLEWEPLVRSIFNDQFINLAMECAFLDSSYLYGVHFRSFFKDKEVKNLVTEKFKKASKSNYIIDKDKLINQNCMQQKNKFPFPHADITFHYNKIFVGSGSGIHYANCSGLTKYGISTRTYKTTDIPTLSLEASYRNLAVAAGENGLFQIPIDHHDYERIEITKEYNLSNNNFNDCHWTFYSIYGSSHINNCVLASFDKTFDKHDRRTYERKFNRLVSDSEIFDDSGYSWGTQDKLYQAVSRRVSVVKYTPWQRDPDFSFSRLGEIELASWKGHVISGGTALFGTVIECENAILIILSNGNVLTIKGEPVNWRVFPRSKNYENQLHIVYEDRVEIYSFNHDYFVDQQSKKAGTSYIGWRLKHFS